MRLLCTGDDFDIESDIVVHVFRFEFGHIPDVVQNILRRMGFRGETRCEGFAGQPS